MMLQCWLCQKVTTNDALLLSADADKTTTEVKTADKPREEKTEPKTTVDEALLRAFRYFDKTGSDLLTLCMFKKSDTCKAQWLQLHSATAGRSHLEDTHHQTCLKVEYCLTSWIQTWTKLLFVSVGTGYIKSEDMRRILHSLGRQMSYRQVKDLCSFVAEVTCSTSSSRSRNDRILYRQLTDKVEVV